MRCDALTEERNGMIKAIGDHSIRMEALLRSANATDTCSNILTKQEDSKGPSERCPSWKRNGLRTKDGPGKRRERKLGDKKGECGQRKDGRRKERG
jgi:hypothetical protein